MMHFHLLVQCPVILAMVKLIFLPVLLGPVIHLSLSPQGDDKEAPVLDVDGLRGVGLS